MILYTNEPKGERALRSTKEGQDRRKYGEKVGKINQETVAPVPALMGVGKLKPPPQGKTGGLHTD
jgi:hypothetical protein